MQTEDGAYLTCQAPFISKDDAKRLIVGSGASECEFMASLKAKLAAPAKTTSRRIPKKQAKGKKPKPAFKDKPDADTLTDLFKGRQ